jgi:hypothetical protein
MGEIKIDTSKGRHVCPMRELLSEWLDVSILIWDGQTLIIRVLSC